MVSVHASTRGAKAERGNLSGLFKPPPRGLIPIGDSGFYRSPDVISPFDCENYPDSPYCGGNPINNPLKNSPVTIDADVSIDECGATVSVGGSLGYVKTPRQTISYRKPGKCRKDYENNKLEPPDFKDDFQPPPITMPGGFNANDEVILIVIYHKYESEIIYSGGEYGAASNSTIISFNKAWYPGVEDAYLTEFGFAKAFCSAECTISIKSNGDAVHSRSRNGPEEASEFSIAYDYKVHIHPELKNKSDGDYRLWFQTNQRQGSYNPNISMHIYHGKFGDINRALPKEPDYEKTVHEGYDSFRNIKYTETNLRISFGQIAFCQKIPDLLDKYKRNPPPPDPPEKHCCMQCCSPATQSNQNNDLKEVLAILRRLDKNVGIFPTKVSIFDADENRQEAQAQVIDIASISQGITRIIERIEKISKIIGIDALPLTVPDSVVDPINSNMIEAVWDWIVPDKTRKINNLFEFLAWMVEQDSAVMGKWQQEITIKDADAVKEGDQEKKIAIPDLSHFCRESLMQQVTLYKVCGLILDVCMKILTQGASSKQEIAKAVVAVRDIQQFLDYPVEEKLLDVPIQITPPENEAEVAYPDNATPEQIAKVDAQNKANKEQSQDLHTYLKPSHTKIKYYDWTGENSFNERLIHLASLIASRGH